MCKATTPATDPSADTALRSKLRQTEDALLDMHQEEKICRQALRRQTEALKRTQRQLQAEQRAISELRSNLYLQSARTSVSERVLAAEIFALERAGPDAAADAKLRQQARQLPKVAATLTCVLIHSVAAMRLVSRAHRWSSCGRWRPAPWQACRSRSPLLIHRIGCSLR